MSSLENHVCTGKASDITGWPRTVPRTRVHLALSHTPSRAPSRAQQSEMEPVSQRRRANLVSISGMGLSECVS